MKLSYLLLGAIGTADSAQAQQAPVATTVFQNYWSEPVPRAQAAYRVQRLETPGKTRLDSLYSLKDNRLRSVSRTKLQPNGDTLTTTTSWRANGNLLADHQAFGTKWHGVQLAYDVNGKLRSRTTYNRGKEVKTECLTESGAVRPCAEGEYAERMPQYPGGMEALFSYLGHAIRYPDSALKKRKQGKVFIGFIVTETGDIRDIRVQKGVWPDLDDEALRVIEAMPRWEPGMQNEELVPVRYTVPITFRIR